MRIEASAEGTDHAELAAAISSVLKDNYRVLKQVRSLAARTAQPLVGSAAQYSQYSQYSPQAFE